MKKYAIVILCLGFITIVSCKKDESPRITKLNESSKEWMPNKYWESFIMVSDTDSLVFELTKIDETPGKILSSSTGNYVNGFEGQVLLNFLSSKSSKPNIEEFEFSLRVYADFYYDRDVLKTGIHNESATCYMIYDLSKMEIDKYWYTHQNYFNMPCGGWPNVTNSFADKLDSLAIGQKSIKDVLHFAFRDSQPGWFDETVTDIYIAKAIGLVRFDLHDGSEYIRKFDQ